MNEMQDRPAGRSIKELHRIIAASDARLDRITSVWNELTDAQQEALATDAEAMDSENAMDES